MHVFLLFEFFCSQICFDSMLDQRNVEVLLLYLFTNMYTVRKILLTSYKETRTGLAVFDFLLKKIEIDKKNSYVPPENKTYPIYGITIARKHTKDIF